jgi:hypothetical protein
MTNWERKATKWLHEHSCPTCGARAMTTGPEVSKCVGIGCGTTIMTTKDLFAVYYRYKVYIIVR